jgi:hypothetical protein
MDSRWTFLKVTAIYNFKDPSRLQEYSRSTPGVLQLESGWSSFGDTLQQDSGFSPVRSLTRTPPAIPLKQLNNQFDFCKCKK